MPAQIAQPSRRRREFAAAFSLKLNLSSVVRRDHTLRMDKIMETTMLFRFRSGRKDPKSSPYVVLQSRAYTPHPTPHLWRLWSLVSRGITGITKQLNLAHHEKPTLRPPRGVGVAWSLCS